MQMIKLVLKLILLFLPIIGIIVVVNYIVDPANLFRSYDYERGIAKILIEQKNASNIVNFDERVLQRLYIKDMKKRKEIVVLGSSRCLGISSELFPGKDIFNSSVSGATVEDYAAIYQMYRKRGMTPAVLILGLDPWILNRYNDQSRWRSISSEYNEIAKIMMPSSRCFQMGIEFQKFAELFSPGYFKESVRALISKIVLRKNKPDTYFETTERVGDYSIKLFDGSLSYDKKYRIRSAQEAYKDAISYAMQNPVYSLGNFDKLDTDCIKRFESFISLLKRDNVKVIFLLPPYHPKTYNILMTSGRYDSIGRAEQYFKSLAASNNIKVLGSYDPDKCMITGADFYDGMHMRNESLNKLYLSEKVFH